MSREIRGYVNFKYDGIGTDGQRMLEGILMFTSNTCTWSEEATL